MRISVLVLAMALLAFAGTANAQMNPMTYCGDLSEADCALLQSSWVAASSATYKGEGSLDVVFDDMSFAATMGFDGNYVLDTALAEEFMAKSMDPAAMMADIYSDSESFLTFLTNYFNLADGDMTLDVSIPAALTGGAVPTDYSIDMWLVDGVAYVDISAFSEIDPSMTGVYGFDLAGFYEELFTNPETAAAFDSMFDNDGAFSENMNSFIDPEFLAEFSSITRLDDSSVNGVDVAVFESTVDYGALFESEVFAQMMEEQMAVQREMMAEQGADEEALAAMDALDTDTIIDLYSAIFEDTTLVMQTAVGLEDGYVYQSVMSMGMDVDAEALSTAIDALGDEGAAPSEMFTSLKVDFDFVVTQSGFGDVAPIEAPAGAQILPASMFGM